MQQCLKFLVEGDQLCYTLLSLNLTGGLEGSMKLLTGIRRISLAIALIVLMSPGLFHSALAAPQPQAQAIAQITTPTDGQTLTGLVTITGSTDHPQFARWELAYGPDPNPNDAWQPFASGTQPVHDGTIGTWNTGIIADGQYMLRLRTVRKDSNYDEAFVRGLQVSNAAPIGTPTSIPPAPTFPAEEPTFTAAEAAQSIATVMVEQPPTSAPEARAIQTNQPQSNTVSRNAAAPAASLDARQFGTACLNGVLLTVGLFVVLGMIQAGRWSVRQVRRSQKRRS